MRTSGNTVLITGGTSGIGLEMADQLIGLGNTVLATGRSQARLKAAKQRLPQLHTFKSDAGDPKAVRDLAQALTRRFPALNVLVNNAGVMRKIDLQGAAGAQDGLCDEIEINLNGPLRMVQAFLPHLKRQPAAAIMNVSSGLAFVPLPISPVYCAAKAGLHSYTLSLRAQLKRTSVAVFELAPPLTQTALLGAFDPRDMEGVPAMPVAELVRQALAGMVQDRHEIRPGSSNALKLMSRIAPGFILGQMSKSVDRLGDPVA